MSRIAILLHDISAMFLAIVVFLYMYFSQYVVVSIFIFIFLITILLLFINYANNKIESLGSHDISDIKNRDISVLWSLSMAVIPLLSNRFEFFTKIDFTNPIVFVFIFLIAFIYYKLNITIPNAMLILFGYHYYSITIDKKEYILLTKNKNLKPFMKINVCELTSNFLLEKR